MNKNLGVGVLILCFGFSSVDAARATQIVEVQPIVVQPTDLSDINEQMLEQDRINRDQELAIRGLVDDNQKLTDTALARQQDATLEKINQTMIDYRDSLLSRDHARIMANGERASKYYDLIHLTEDVDDAKGDDALILKRNVIEEKYKILTELKDEMTALNTKLKDEEAHKNFEQINGLQEQKIQMLTQRLADMDQRIARYDEILAEKDQEIAQLKEDLAKIQSDASTQSKRINEQKDQVNTLQGTVSNLALSQMQDEVSSKDRIIKEQAKQIDLLQRQPSNLDSFSNGSVALAPIVVNSYSQGNEYSGIEAELFALKNKIVEQSNDLQAKENSIRWLNQVLAATRDKAAFYQLTTQQDKLAMQQVQGQVQGIKDDFTTHLKDYNQFEGAIIALRNQVSRLGGELTQKQNQVNVLKTELQDKITQENDQAQQETRIQQDLKAELQDKEGQIDQMKADVKAILQAQANKEIYRRKASDELDDRVHLAKELIDLQSQEAALLDEKDNLRLAQNNIFEQHAMNIESKIKTLLFNSQIQTSVLENRMEELKRELYQKEQQVGLLKTELENKISEEKNQGMLALQIQDLKTQLQDKEDQINAMNTTIQEGQQSKQEADSLRQQLAAVQDKADQLKQQLDSKTAESNKLSAMMGDYQQKLESKDSAYNEQLGKILSSRNDKNRLEKQIDYLIAQLQNKEAQVAKIKKDMSDLQEMTAIKDSDMQAKDLNLSIMQQKMVDERINEYQAKINALQVSSKSQVQEVTSLKADLALARQQLEGMPSSDEIEFLRTGLKKATSQLKQRDEMLAQIKANADEYSKEFKAQTMEFQSLKEQLQDAYDDLHRKDEDLKYKDLEIVRLKERTTVNVGGLQDQVTILTQRLDAAEKKLMSKTHDGRAGVLQAQLDNANAQIKAFQAQVKELEASSKDDPYGRKLRQALDKIDEQGRVLNALIQKLHDVGQSVNLTKIVASEGSDYFSDGVRK